MSFQSKTDQALEAQLPTDLTLNATAFEKFIMQCLKAPEWEIRSWLRKTLTRAGFRIIEDDYQSDRVKKDSRYSTVHNMLAIRGNPKVCLVAHTDICRDHGMQMFEYDDFAFLRNEEAEIVKKPAMVSVEPAIKYLEVDGEKRRIIQEKENRAQVGGDDRLGVAINTYIALNTGYDMALLFATDEEIGLKSASVCNFPELKEFDLLLETDRGNHRDQLVLKINGLVLCEYEMATRLLEIAYDGLNCREVVSGAGTDVYALKKRDMCKNAVNCTVGYWNSYGSQQNEYIDVVDAENALKFVSAVVKSFYLEG